MPIRNIAILLQYSIAREMGTNQSAPTDQSLSPLGVGTLVKEIGLAMIPIHLRHSLESIMQILGKPKQKTEQFYNPKYLDRDADQTEAV